MPEAAESPKEKKKPASPAGMMLSYMDDGEDDSYQKDKEELESSGFKVTGTSEGKPVSASYETDPVQQDEPEETPPPDEAAPKIQAAATSQAGDEPKKGGMSQDLANALITLGSGIIGSIASRAMGGYGNQGFASGFKGAADYYQKKEDEKTKMDQALQLAEAKKREQMQKKTTFKPDMVEYIVPSTGQRGWGTVDYNKPSGQQFTDRFGNALPQDAVPMKSEKTFVGEGGTLYSYQPGTGTVSAPRVTGQGPAPQPTGGDLPQRAAAHRLPPVDQSYYQASGIGEKEISKLDQLKATRTPSAEKEYAKLVDEYSKRIETAEKRGYEKGQEKEKITREAVKPRQDKLSKGISYFQQFVPLLSDIKNTKDPDEQRVKAESLAKLINTMQTASSDAVGAEEVGRLLPETKFKVANFFGPGAVFGTDIPGFIKRMDDTLKAMHSYIKTEADTIEVPAGFEKGGFPGRYPNFTSPTDVKDLTTVGDRFMVNGILYERTTPDANGNYLRKVK